jgi:DNA ligase (NAD+)
MLYSKEDVIQLTAATKSVLSENNENADQIYLQTLKDLIVFHEYRYYVLDEPLISDHEYDIIYKKLQAVEAKHPTWITPDSPTQRVSSDLADDFPSVPHLRPMLSLENSYDDADLLDFDKQVRKLVGLKPDDDIVYVAEPKFDGGTIVLMYENDRLVRAATRGNGSEGEEITHNAKAIKAIPVKAAFSQSDVSRIELRGEAIIRKSKFYEINKAREEAGLTLFANPRNAATGALRVKDSSEIKARAIEAFIYQVSVAQDAHEREVDIAEGRHSKTLEKLGSLGFKVPREVTKVCHGIEEVMAFCREWSERRDTYDYEIDGIVIKVDRLDWQEICGTTSHHPRWAVAYKFKAKQATSKLLQVEYQVGKTGAITPVAKIQPVPLAGVTVSSISLHNEDFIQSKDIRIGDTVLVERAGDVIPYIVKSLEELRTGEEQVITFPTHCPSCESLLQRPEGEAAWRCINVTCPAQSIQRIIHHVSKDGMDIDGFGKSFVEKFAELGWLNDISDVYQLDYDKISKLEGFGSKSAENLRKAIDKAKGNPISRLLQSLSVHHLGKKASKLIAEKVGYIPDLQHWPAEKYTEIHEIGPVLAQNMVRYFSIPENIALIERLESAGVNMRQTEKDRPSQSAADGVLAGKTILFTGTLQQMGRNDAQKLAESAGAKNISAVSSNLNILVVGENAGSKLKKAEALGTVEIWTEDEFLEKVVKE